MDKNLIKRQAKQKNKYFYNRFDVYQRNVHAKLKHLL